MSWLASRPQLRPLAFAVLAAVLLLGGAAWMAHSGAPSTTAKPASPTAPVATQRPIQTPIESGQGVADAGPAQPTAGSSVLSAFVDAKTTAAGFTTAYYSYRWDDSPTIVRARLRPFDTAAFDAQMGQGSGAAAGSAGLAQRHEVGQATILDLTPQVFDSEGRLLVAAYVRVDVSSDAGKASRTTSLELLLAKTDKGWRVDEVKI